MDTKTPISEQEQDVLDINEVDTQNEAEAQNDVEAQTDVDAQKEELEQSLQQEEEAQRQKEEAQRQKEEAQRQKEEAQRQKEEAQRQKEEALRQKKEALRQKKEALLAALVKQRDACLLWANKTKVKLSAWHAKASGKVAVKRRKGQKVKLRVVAWVQCTALRLRHHTVRFITSTVSKVLHALVSVRILHIVGEFFYAMGFQTEYRTVLLGRLIRKTSLFLWHTVFGQVLRVLRAIWREIVIIWQELFRPFYVFTRGIYRLLAHGAKITKERNIFFGVCSAIAYLFRGLFRYVHVLPGMISYVLPFIAAAGFILVVQTTLAEEYTLEVKVDGVTIGYVENEMVFENAKDDVQERVDYAVTTATSWDVSPTYTLSTMEATHTEEELADALLMISSEEISEATAVYIDGILCLVTDGGDELQAYLDSLTAPYEDDDDPTLVLSFNKEIELVDGIYFTDSFTDVNEIIQYFSGLEAAQINYTVVAGDSWSLIASKNGMTQVEIFAMNPGTSADTAIFPGDEIIIGLEKAVLEVLLYRTIEYDETISYSTTKTESSDYNFGTTKITQTGVDGVRHITAEVVYDVNGNLLSSEIIASEITLEPVEQIEVVGTYLSSGMIAEVGTGTIMWPVPNYTYVSRWASSSHDGVDICGPAGTAIYAADSGVVIKAGYNAAGTGYGYSIVIDHGNGYQTLYAHGLSVAVSVGDVVSQGDYIMPMGSTGYSTGNHLHFEITYYGSLIWPQSIF